MKNFFDSIRDDVRFHIIRTGEEDAHPEDASYNNRSLYPKSKSYKWMADTDKFVFTEDGVLMVQSPGAKSANALLNIDQINIMAKTAGTGSSSVCLTSPGPTRMSVISTNLKKTEASASIR